MKHIKPFSAAYENFDQTFANKLHYVKVSKYDTCYTYALKRIGCGSLLNPYLDKNNILDIYKHFEEHDIIDIEHYNSLPIGTIVCWDAKRQYTNLPTIIDEQGNIQEESVIDNIHLGVIEADRSISVCTFRQYGVKHIRKINPVDNMPNKYFTKK